MSNHHKKKFLKKQFYPGGQKAIEKFICENLIYPQDALDNKIEGTVIVAYDVETNGKVLNVKVIKELGFGCDVEAMRLVKLLRFTDAKQRGLLVTLSTKINIHFKLPVDNTININYLFKPSVKNNDENYNITISSSKTENP